MIGRSIPLTSVPQVWEPAIRQIFKALTDLVDGDENLARRFTKGDLQLIQQCGNPDVDGKRAQLYVQSVKQVFFPKRDAKPVGKITVNPDWFKTAEHKAKYVVHD